MMGHTALRLPPALFLALALAGCGPARPLFEPPPTLYRDPAPRPPPPTLSRTIGFSDPGHQPRKVAPGRLEIAAEGPPIAKPFEGSIALSTSTAVTFTQGQTRVVPFGLDVRARNDVPAGIRTIRVAGFDGVTVGLERSFQTWSAQKGHEVLGAFALAALQGSLWLLGFRFEKKPEAPAKPHPFSLDVPKGHTGIGALRVTVSDGTAPGRYAGSLEIEGNFATRSFPFEIVVVRFEEKVAALLAKIDAPEADTALGALLAKTPAPKRPREMKRISVDMEAEADGAPKEHGLWKRWLPAGSGIYDLGALAWLGPVTDTKDNEDGEQRVLTGPRDDPRLFVLNGRSVDVIRIRERRTVERIATPDLDELTGPLRVSASGDRVLVRCNHAPCFFRRDGDKWVSRVITDLCPSPQSCAWVEADPELEELVAAMTPEYRADPLDAVVRYDLTTGKRSEAALDPPCSTRFPFDHRYSARHRLVVGLIRDESATGLTARAVGLTFVDLANLRVTRHAVPSTQVDGLTIDEASGDVFFETVTDRFDLKTAACVAVTPGTLKTRRCDGAPPRPPKLVAGTSVLYGVRDSVVSYAR